MHTRMRATSPAGCLKSGVGLRTAYGARREGVGSPGQVHAPNQARPIRFTIVIEIGSLYTVSNPAWAAIALRSEHGTARMSPPCKLKTVAVHAWGPLCYL